MTAFAGVFDKVFVINLAKRTDRWTHARGQLASLGIEAERFEAHANVLDDNGRVSGNNGCTASHRALLELIRYNRWECVLILEDDFELRRAIGNNFHAILEQTFDELPDDWRMLYLGGGYGENPKRRFSKHLIETNAVMTTSSYCLGWRQAEWMAPYIHGGPIDSLYHRFNREPNCFMATPRLFVQMPGFSDLTESHSDNGVSMEDSRHEEMLLEGEIRLEDEFVVVTGGLQQRELAAPHDIDGREFIVDGRTLKLDRIDLPKHPAPWFRGEPVTYFLK